MNKTVLTLVVLGSLTNTMWGELRRERKAPQVEVTVDARIELLAVVQTLGKRQNEVGRVTRYPSVYKDDVLAYFAMCKDHPAVTLCDQLARSGFSYDAPPAAMLYLSQPPELATGRALTDYLKQRVGDEKKFTEFVRRLRAFAHQSNFMEFFRAHKGSYDRMVEITKSDVHLDDPAMLEAYYRISQHSYTIILAPLYHHGGYGVGVGNDNGMYDIYSIQGPQGRKDGYPWFGDEAAMREVTWHEFSHSFVNPHTEKHLERVNALDSLFQPIQWPMKNMAYTTWEICVNEHVVRAVTIRLKHKTEGEQAAQALLHMEKARGFLYIEPVCRALEAYERQPDKYPDFAAFYPEIIETLKAQLDASSRPAKR